MQIPPRTHLPCPFPRSLWPVNRMSCVDSNTLTGRNLEIFIRDGNILTCIRMNWNVIQVVKPPNSIGPNLIEISIQFRCLSLIKSFKLVLSMSEKLNRLFNFLIQSNLVHSHYGNEWPPGIIFDIDIELGISSINQITRVMSFYRLLDWFDWFSFIDSSRAQFPSNNAWE